MSLSQYTTPAEVRSALSVNSTELPDSELNQPLVFQRLDMRLYEIKPNLMTSIDAVEAKLPGDRTASEARFLTAAKLLCTYAVAIDFVPTLTTLMLRVLDDGKASQERFDEAFGDTIAGIQSMYEMAKNRTVAWLTVIEGGAYIAPVPTEPVLIRSTGLAVDPVTGA